MMDMIRTTKNASSESSIFEEIPLKGDKNVDESSAFTVVSNLSAATIFSESSCEDESD
jgi:hypothetical protein